MRLLLFLARGLKTSATHGPLLGVSSAGRAGRPLPRALPRTLEEYHQLSTTPPSQDGKIVKVAVVGEPNVGKSTLINSLIASDVCPVSKKAHTTRSANQASLTTGALQMILVDTPGAVGSFHASRHHLPTAMVEAPSRVLENQVDVLAVVVDASDHWRREFLSTEVAQLLQRHRKEAPDACSILILNKVDRLDSKRKLLPCVNSLCEGVIDGRPLPMTKALPKKTTDDLKTRIWEKETRRQQEKEAKQQAAVLREKHDPPDPGTYKPEFPPRYASWPYFKRVFMVSATENDGIDDVRSFLEERSRHGIWECRPEFVYNQKPKDLVQDITRGRLLDNLRDEIPYEVKPRIVYWNLDDSGCALHIHISIDCVSDRQVRAILGSEGKTIRRITEQLRQRLCDVFHCEIALKLIVVNKRAKAKPAAPVEQQKKTSEGQA